MFKARLEGEFLVQGGKRIGRVSSNVIYDGHGAKIGRIDRDTIYDGHGHRVGRVDGQSVYDGTGHRVGTLDQVRREIDGPGGTTLAALWLLLLR